MPSTGKMDRAVIGYIDQSRIYSQPIIVNIDTNANSNHGRNLEWKLVVDCLIILSIPCC